MRTPRRGLHLLSMVLSAALLLASCAAPHGTGPTPDVVAADEVTQLRWLDRVSWGANASSAAQLAKQGLPTWLRDQLHPAPARLPA
ncbi:MAG: hypothetical protein JWQ41_406, partial [Variovorax sp.]|nr:hypothetical protein [Variovorax sp.]